MVGVFVACLDLASAGRRWLGALIVSVQHEAAHNAQCRQCTKRGGAKEALAQKTAKRSAIAKAAATALRSDKKLCTIHKRTTIINTGGVIPTRFSNDCY